MTKKSGKTKRALRALRARVLRPSPASIRRLARVLQRGDLVGVPTETVYGLAANAWDAAACAKIFRAKGRPSTDPLIVHVLTRTAAEKVAVFNPLAITLARAFWPGPLTLVLPKRANVPSIVTAGLDSVAVRAPRHAVFRALLKATALPLAAPSANPFGYISPTTALHVRDSLGDRIGYVLDGGPCRVGVESTIVDARDPKCPRILRPGWITAEQIAAATGLKVISKSETKPASAAPRESVVSQLAPGMLARHYSPNTPLRLVKRIQMRDLRATTDVDRVAWVFFSKKARIVQRTETRQFSVYWLSHDGSPAAAARSLFGLLRRLDAKAYREIVAETAPPSPWAQAINDRLRRAAAKR